MYILKSSAWRQVKYPYQQQKNQITLFLCLKFDQRCDLLSNTSIWSQSCNRIDILGLKDQNHYVEDMYYFPSLAHIYNVG